MAAIITKLYALLSQRKVYLTLYYLCFIACPITYFAILYLPNLNEHNFISENAIKVPTVFEFSEDFCRDFIKMAEGSIDQNFTALEWITKTFQENKLPHRYFPNSKNFVGIYNAPRGMGQDAFLIAFRYDVSDGQSLEYLIPMAFLQLLMTNENMNWLSKDIIFLAYPSSEKTYGRAAKDFLDFYYSELHTWELPRPGIIRQMISLEIQSNRYSTIELNPFGINTMLPDFDYYSFIAETLQGKGYPMVIDEDMELETQVNNLIFEGIIKAKPYIKDYIQIDSVLKEPYTFYLNSLKQLLLSNPHDMHPYFQE